MTIIDDRMKRYETLYPPDWNPSEEYFEEWEAEYAIATDAEGWAEIDKERERLYLEAVKLREEKVKLSQPGDNQGESIEGD